MLVALAQKPNLPSKALAQHQAVGTVFGTCDTLIVLKHYDALQHLDSAFRNILNGRTKSIPLTGS